MKNYDGSLFHPFWVVNFNIWTHFKLFNHHLKPIKYLLVMHHKMFNKHEKSTGSWVSKMFSLFQQTNNCPSLFQPKQFQKQINFHLPCIKKLRSRSIRSKKTKERKSLGRKIIQIEERKKKKTERGKIVKRIFKCSMRYENDASFVIVTVFIKRRKILFTRWKVTLGKCWRKKCQSGFYFYFFPLPSEANIFYKRIYLK